MPAFYRVGQQLPKWHRSAGSFGLQVFNYCAAYLDSAQVNYALLVIQITPLETQGFAYPQAGHGDDEHQGFVRVLQLHHGGPNVAASSLCRAKGSEL